MKIVAIIQARMGSTRLPGKMMMKIAGKPVVAHVFDRVRTSRLIDETWLATTVDPSDDVLAKWAEENGMPCFRGSVDDVLDRYYQTAHKAGADAIIRITGDCPLHDHRVIDKVIRVFGDNSKYDYVSNINPPTYPDGLDVEIFSFATLKEAWEDAKLKSEREHVTPYIYKHLELFRLKNVKSDQDLSSYRLTLDEPEDLDLIEKIVYACSIEGCSLEEIVKLLSDNPNWTNLNNKYHRNEGYLKSLKED